MKRHVIRHARSAKSFFSAHKKQFFGGIGIAFLLIVLVQVFYPSSRLLPFASVDGVSVGGWHKKDATWELNKRYESAPVNIYFGDTDTPQKNPQPADIGLSLSNDERVQSLAYPWYVKIIPTSVLWYGQLYEPMDVIASRDEAMLNDYMADEIGNSCDIKPKNATLAVSDNSSLTVVEAVPGGVCEVGDVKTALMEVQPMLKKPTNVNIAVETIAPSIPTKDAEDLKQIIDARLANGVALKVNDEIVTIDAATVRKWLAFNAKEDKITTTINTKKAASYFAKSVSPKVARAPGVTKITTRDFTVLSKKVGSKGRALDIGATEFNIISYLTNKRDEAVAVTKIVEPKVDYTRTYTKTSTGIAALLAQYAKDTPGSYGVAFQELGGSGRTAQYDGDRSFTTASTYKLFVAYGTLRNIDSGKWKWSDNDIAGGRDLSKCFDDMIVLSDNACAEALLKKLGPSDLTKDIRALGLVNSGFISGSTPNTTANDLALFLAKLQSDQLPIKSDSRSRLLDAMGRQVYRQGVPAGASGKVANKVGFLWGLLHDASIVYSSNGTYVLVVLTDGSSWGNIAELTKKIEGLR